MPTVYCLCFTPSAQPLSPIMIRSLQMLLELHFSVGKSDFAMCMKGLGVGYLLGCLRCLIRRWLATACCQVTLILTDASLMTLLTPRSLMKACCRRRLTTVLGIADSLSPQGVVKPISGIIAAAFCFPGCARLIRL